MKKGIALSAIAFLTTSVFAGADTDAGMQAKLDALMMKMELMEKRELAQQQTIDSLTSEIKKMKNGKVSMSTTPVQDSKIETLEKKLAKVEKKQASQAKNITSVKKMAAKDNVKFGVEFRNTVESLRYEDNKNDQTENNPSLLTSRLFLNMSASPMNGLIFKGKLAIYSTWGAHLYGEDNGLKSWAGSSKATDTVMRIKEAYFVYNTQYGEQPISVSVGRRPASNGFLANMRENEETSGSPLAHITNMEVDAAMVKLDWDRFIPGAYTKLVYGRAHTGEHQGVYGQSTEPARFPYAQDPYDTGYEDDNVDFFVMPGSAYNDGQYQLMYQWAHIFNTKGKHIDTGAKKGAAGVADLYALSLKVDGIGDEISDFLDETSVFASVAYTNYDAKAGNSILGSDDGGSKSGQSFWIGALIPDMITDSGKLGFEYNHGSQYWTPMTWAEDTAIGSKIAVRGDAYEMYWNFDLFGVKYLPSQIRYTYMQHDYTPNINCAGWVTPEKTDITSQNIRAAITYKY